MKRSIAPFALCFLLVLLVTAPVSTGAEKPPKELWDEFPLDATPTPGAQAPEPSTPPPSQQEPAPAPDATDDGGGGGISTPALLILLVGAAGLGGAAVVTAGRRMRRDGQEPAAAPAARNGRFARDAAQPATANGAHRADADDAPRKAHPVSREKAARRARRATPPQPQPVEASAADRATEPVDDDAPEKAPVARHDPAPAPPPPPRPVEPAPAEAAREPAPDDAATESWTARRRGTWKPSEDAAPVARDIAAERIARPEPVADADDGGFPACRIKLHNRPIRTHFYAVPYEGGPVLARSPYFKLQRGEDESGPTAPEALRALVEELRELGWEQTGVGSAPWDLRFQRGVRVAQRRG